MFHEIADALAQQVDLLGVGKVHRRALLCAYATARQVLILQETVSLWGFGSSQANSGKALTPMANISLLSIPMVTVSGKALAQIANISPLCSV
ncbi:MAG: hypothetical protein NVS2B12_30590 [Ktedonobacteraceae bacterium]